MASFLWTHYNKVEDYSSELLSYHSNTLLAQAMANKSESTSTIHILHDADISTENADYRWSCILIVTNNFIFPSEQLIDLVYLSRECRVQYEQ